MKHFSLRDIFWYNQETLDDEREILLNGSPEEQDFIKEQKSRRNLVYNGCLGGLILGGSYFGFEMFSNALWDAKSSRMLDLFFYFLNNDYNFLLTLTNSVSQLPLPLTTIISAEIVALSFAGFYGINSSINNEKYEKLESKLE
ncbi:MAG: hypothetical protein ABIF40_05060 [archaeon]